MKPRLLLVEDDEPRAAMLERVLAREHECVVVHTADEALRALAAGDWDAAVVDYDLGRDGTGLLVLQAVRLLDDRTARLLYSSYYSGALAQDAGRLGGAQAVLDARRGEFLLELKVALARLSGAGAVPAGEPPAGSGDGAAPWCARAPASLRLLEELLQVASETTPVFVHGEPGSGKHLAAATLQRWRRERGGPAAGGAPEREQKARVIRVPPLRERREDLAGLAERFLAGLARAGRPGPRLGAGALAELEKRAWWGNVRELHATLLRAARTAAERREVGPDDLPHDIVPPGSAMHAAKQEGMLQAALLHLRTAGSIRAAAALAGESRPNYKRRLNQLGILRADVTREPGEPEGE